VVENQDGEREKKKKKRVPNKEGKGRDWKIEGICQYHCKAAEIFDALAVLCRSKRN
jgi:hypothetical protein